MILKGSQRANGANLATHLMQSFDNETVEILRQLIEDCVALNRIGRQRQMRTVFFDGGIDTEGEDLRWSEIPSRLLGWKFHNLKLIALQSTILRRFKKRKALQDP